MKKTKLAAVAGAVGLGLGAIAIAGWSAVGPAHGDRTAVSHPTGPTEISFQPAPMQWVTCPPETLTEGTFPGQCGTLTVPLDYADPLGTTVTLAVTRIAHTSSEADYQGVMLVNPGGPGKEGIATAQMAKNVPHEAGGDYDWIGFDPRGVGFSRPRLSCDAHYFDHPRPAYRPATPAQEAAWLKRSEDYADACATAGGSFLDHLKSVDTVNDMDSLRKALGREQINFYGYSYGTYLGELYSTLYPTRVRRMVLDGVVDPGRSWYDANLDQNVGFEKAMGLYFRWVARYHDVYRLGRSEAEVRARFDAQRRQLTRTPAGRTIGVDEWDDVFLSAAYSVLDWERLTTAFADYAHHGRWKRLRTMYDAAYPQKPGWDNDRAMYLATVCTDGPFPADWSTWAGDDRVTYPRAPLITWLNTWFNAPCHFWPAAPGTRQPVTGERAPAILLISETYDAATPFAGALETRRRFPRSVLIEGLGGSTHAASIGRVACTDDLVAAYLAAGALPERRAGDGSDRKCPPVPEPNPRHRPRADSR